MIETKQIDDKDLVQFIELFILYNKCLITNHNKSNSTYMLLDKLKKEGSIATGLYKNGLLVGFTLGNKQDEHTFHFTDMYVLPYFRFHILKLLIASEKAISGLYKGWVSESHTKEGINMFEHYGAKQIQIQIKYYKDI